MSVRHGWFVAPSCEQHGRVRGDFDQGVALYESAQLLRTDMMGPMRKLGWLPLRGRGGGRDRDRASEKLKWEL